MIPWTLLGSSAIPGEKDEMRLFQRDGEYSIRIGHQELMNNRIHASEDALATLACARIAGRPRPRLLIGGLGMGFTLAAVLRDVGPAARVVVAELVPAVLEWNRGPLASLAGHPLDDPRVSVEVIDVARLIAAERVGFDAILLDVDNGPAGLTSKVNDALYSSAGLGRIRSALRPAGILSIWSAAGDASFKRRFCHAGFEVEEIPVRGRGAAGGPRYVIWIGKRDDTPKR